MSDTKQDYETPPELFEACARRFGRYGIDLAANATNTKCRDFLTLNDECDSLITSWNSQLNATSESSDIYWLRGWLNCPFGDSNIWTRKCAEEARLGARITLLTQAKPGTVWFRKHVVPYADVYFLTDRIQFVGTPHPFPLECIVADYNPGRRRPPCFWGWKKDVITEWGTT